MYVRDFCYYLLVVVFFSFHRDIETDTMIFPLTIKKDIQPKVAKIFILKIIVSITILIQYNTIWLKHLELTEQFSKFSLCSVYP